MGKQSEPHENARAFSRDSLHSPKYESLLACPRGKKALTFSLNSTLFIRPDTFYGPLSVCINGLCLYFYPVILCYRSVRDLWDT